MLMRKCCCVTPVAATTTDDVHVVPPRNHPKETYAHASTLQYILLLLGGEYLLFDDCRSCRDMSTWITCMDKPFQYSTQNDIHGEDRRCVWWYCVVSYKKMKYYFFAVSCVCSVSWRNDSGQGKGFPKIAIIFSRKMGPRGALIVFRIFSFLSKKRNRGGTGGGDMSFFEI